MAPVANGNPSCEVPHYWKIITFNKTIEQCVGPFERVVAITPESGAQPGENYSSLMLRVKVDVELKDGNQKRVGFVLKTQHSNEMMAQILNMMQLFPKEEEMYQRIIPKFEELYRDAGKNVELAPRSFRFDRDIGEEYVLLEDLCEQKYKNANRVTGFDMEHMREVLKKLAEFHAVSASYVEHYGMYGEQFTVGVFNENNRKLLTEFNTSQAFLMQLKKWKNCQEYYEKLADSDNYLVDRLLQDQKVNTSEFNVLNHGDCWANNILFQYDAFGKIRNTRFIDFQLCKYGSPAIDLYYLILSSASMDIKVSQFDAMVRIYYDILIENLKLLQYQRPLPKLKNLFSSLFRHGLCAYMVVSKVMPVVMLDKTENANLENYMEDASKMKQAMFTNIKYVQAMADIMPWLDNRGLLDWKTL